MLLLVDADSICYSAACAHWDGNSLYSRAPFYVIAKTLTNLIEEHNEYLSLRFSPKHIKLYVTSEDKSNFRIQLPCPDEYKANRKGRRKPPDLLNLKQYLVDNFKAEMVFGQEADDAIGIEACRHDSKDVLISSVDKDLSMIPGTHWKHDKWKDPFLVTDPGFIQVTRVVSRPRDPEKKPSPSWKITGGGLRWFYYQLLAGDVADHVKHPWRYGQYELLDYSCFLNSLHTEDALYQYVLSVYQNKGSSEERMIQNGRLLWIRRKPDEIWKQ